MGMRVRLRASYDISKLPRQAQVVARALQRYGMILSDNGGNWFVTGTPDARWDSSQLATLKLIKGRDLEVVHMANIRAN